MDRPDVHYAITDDDVRIAFQDFGNGPPTVVVPGLFFHVEGAWDIELVRERFLERMAANLRILMLDPRGTGMSDGFTESPSLRDRALDIKAVTDAAGVERANLIGIFEGGPVAVGFAAEYPQRVDRLVLTNSDVGPSLRQRARELNPDMAEPSEDLYAAVSETPGIENELFVRNSPSSTKYPDYIPSLIRFQRLVGTRDTWRRQTESLTALDVVEVAPLVQAPTLMTHTIGNRSLFHVGYARLLAELIPNSILAEFEGEDHHYWLGASWRDIVDAHISFITGTEVEAPVERRFAVVLFTDIVESTSLSMATGDDKWHQQLDTHDRIAGRVISKHDGTIIKHTGDGVLATFTTPSQAVDAALQLRDELAETGIQIRAGLHGGEIELRGDDISGAVVNLAARVEQAATDGDIYTTKTIRDMLIGTPHHFDEAGTHTLKGFDEEWRLYRIVANRPPPISGNMGGLRSHSPES